MRRGLKRLARRRLSIVCGAASAVIISGWCGQVTGKGLGIVSSAAGAVGLLVTL